MTSDPPSDPDMIAAAARAKSWNEEHERGRVAIETLKLIRDRAKSTSAERWIDDSCAIHSLAYCALRDSATTPAQDD